MNLRMTSETNPSWPPADDINLRFTRETKDFSRRRRSRSIFFSQQQQLRHKSIRLSENILHDPKTDVTNSQRSSTFFAICSLRIDHILIKMEDFSRFLIFDFYNRIQNDSGNQNDSEDFDVSLSKFSKTKINKKVEDPTPRSHVKHHMMRHNSAPGVLKSDTCLISAPESKVSDRYLKFEFKNSNLNLRPFFFEYSTSFLLYTPIQQWNRPQSLLINSKN